MDINQYNNQHCNQNINQAINNMLTFYLHKHSKVLVVRFDIRYHEDYQNIHSNTDISSCIAKIIQKYKRYNLDPAYIWVREQDSSIHPHYHCALLLNGHKVQNKYHVFITAENLWRSTINSDSDGLIHHCNISVYGKKHENGIMLRKCDDNYHDRLKDVTRQVMYLAKDKDKGGYNDGLRDFGMTRIK